MNIDTTEAADVLRNAATLFEASDRTHSGELSLVQVHTILEYESLPQDKASDGDSAITIAETKELFTSVDDDATGTLRYP